MSTEESTILTEAAPEQPSFAKQFAHFMTRTSTVYATSPLSILSDRGIENRLLDNLVEHLPAGAIIAGGFITSVILEEKTATDIDFFFTSRAAFNETARYIASLSKSTTKINDGAWAYSGYTLKDHEPGELPDLDELAKSNTRFLNFVHPTRPSIQLLCMVWYDSAEHVIDTFDFTIVQCAVSRVGLSYNPMMWLDLSRKRIVLSRLQFPSSTLRRLIKYAHKGFYACPGSLAHICEQIQSYKGATDVNAVVYVD